MFDTSKRITRRRSSAGPVPPVRPQRPREGFNAPRSGGLRPTFLACGTTARSMWRIFPASPTASWPTWPRRPGGAREPPPPLEELEGRAFSPRWSRTPASGLHQAGCDRALHQCHPGGAGAPPQQSGPAGRRRENPWPGPSWRWRATVCRGPPLIRCCRKPSPPAAPRGPGRSRTAQPRRGGGADDAAASSGGRHGGAPPALRWCSLRLG